MQINETINVGVILKYAMKERAVAESGSGKRMGHGPNVALIECVTWDKPCHLSDSSQFQDPL